MLIRIVRAMSLGPFLVFLKYRDPKNPAKAKPKRKPRLGLVKISGPLRKSFNRKLHTIAIRASRGAKVKADRLTKIPCMVIGTGKKGSWIRPPM